MTSKTYLALKDRYEIIEAVQAPLETWKAFRVDVAAAYLALQNTVVLGQLGDSSPDRVDLKEAANVLQLLRVMRQIADSRVDAFLDDQTVS